MNLRTFRFSRGPTSTLGLFFVDGKFECFVLEDRHREVKVPGETRIPAGTYAVKLQTAGRIHADYSNRFPDIHRGTLMLQDVPGFTGIALHCGNHPGDTDGCQLVGDGATQNVTDEGAVTGSTAAYKRVYPRIAAALLSGEAVTIEVQDEP